MSRADRSPGAAARRAARRWMLALGALAAGAAASPAAGQDSSLTRRPVGRTFVGDAAVLVNVRSDDRVELAVSADSARTITLLLSAGAVRMWADSTARVLAFRPRNRAAREAAYRSDADAIEPAAGSIVLTRRPAAEPDSGHVLAFAPDSAGGFALTLTAEEARAFVALMRRAVRRDDPPRPAAPRPGA